MAQQHTVGSHKTAVVSIDGVLTVIYHQTPVVRVFEDKIILNTGGYFTPTTKTRMNQASTQYDLGFRVFQKQGTWYVYWNCNTVEFEGDSVVLNKKNDN